MCNPKEQILERDEDYCDKVLYVVRGSIIEKDGQYDDQVPMLKLKRYNIACL